MDKQTFLHVTIFRYFIDQLTNVIHRNKNERITSVTADIDYRGVRSIVSPSPVVIFIDGSTTCHTVSWQLSLNHT